MEDLLQKIYHTLLVVMALSVCQTILLAFALYLTVKEAQKLDAAINENKKE